jgi:predicted phosphoribosyltransferase
MFRNREDAACQLAEELKGRELHDPLVLAIPRGGVVTGAVLARELGTDLDVVLSRKLRAPGQPELAVGAVSEDGQVFLNHHARPFLERLKEYLVQERRHQWAEIARRKKLFRSVRTPAPVAGRSVIVTDDGIATGSTMIAALQAIKTQNPLEVIVAVPVASPERLKEVRRWCDDVVCLLSPQRFWAIGQFYEEFTQVEDQEVLQLLREFAPAAELRHPKSQPGMAAGPAPLRRSAAASRRPIPAVGRNEACLRRFGGGSCRGLRGAGGHPVPCSGPSGLRSVQPICRPGGTA